MDEWGGYLTGERGRAVSSRLPGPVIRGLVSPLPGFANAVRPAAGHGDHVTSDPFTAGLVEVRRLEIIEAGLRNERLRGRTCSSVGGR